MTNRTKEHDLREPSPPRSEPERPAGPAARLRLAIKSRGWESIAAFARAIGMSDNRIHQQLNRDSLSKEDSLRYASFLSVPLDWLLTGAGQPDFSTRSLLTRPELEKRAHDAMRAVDKMPRHQDLDGLTYSAPPANAQIPAEQPERLVGDRDLPVYSSAQGGNGGMTVDPTPIEWVKRPTPLQSVQKGFAVYVVGESMSPAFEHGDMVLVHPNLPVSRGDDALLVNSPVEGGDWSAIVKRVLGWSDKAWKLQQFNPKREFEAPRATFPHAYRIVGKYNRR